MCELGLIMSDFLLFTREKVFHQEKEAMILKQVELIEAFLSKSDREIVQFAREYDVDLTLEEVRRLRPLTQSASITWIVTGIPKNVLKDVERIIGRRKLKKLLNFID